MRWLRGSLDPLLSLWMGHFLNAPLIKSQKSYLGLRLVAWKELVKDISGLCLERVNDISIIYI